MKDLYIGGMKFPLSLFSRLYNPSQKLTYSLPVSYDPRFYVKLKPKRLIMESNCKAVESSLKYK
jgi:hypothetical protein